MQNQLMHTWVAIEGGIFSEIIGVCAESLGLSKMNKLSIYLEPGKVL